LLAVLPIAIVLHRFVELPSARLSRRITGLRFPFHKCSLRNA
jgi:hypothetical protein